MAELHSGRLKLLAKLFKCGYTTEKQIAGMGVAELLKIPKLTATELRGIGELQKAVKAGAILPFLAATEEEKPDET